MVKYFKYPFATGGDKTAIPNPTQVSGAVSYQQGFGPDYQKDLLTDPTAKPIPRPESNQLDFDITSNIQQYQQHGVPEFITSSDNSPDGAFSYSKNALVRKDPGTGYRTYISLEDANTDTPPSSKWAIWEPVSFQNSIFTSGTTTGSANAYVLALSPALTALVSGLSFRAIANFTNTASATIAVSGLTATGIKMIAPTGLIDLSGGEILSGVVYDFFYNGTNFILLNPSSVHSVIGKVWFAPGGGGQAGIPAGSAETKLLFDTTSATYDPFSMWDATNKRFVIPVTGFYQVEANVIVTTGTTNVGFWPLPYLNGSTASDIIAYNNFTPTGSNDAVNGVTNLYLTSGTTVEMRLHVDGVVAVNVDVTRSTPTTYFSIKYLGK